MRVTLESTPVIVELDMALPRGAGEGATDIGIPVVTLVAGIWPQTDDSAVLAQFTAELEVLEAAGIDSETIDRLLADKVVAAQ